MPEPKVRFSLTDTHGEENPWYSLELELENFASPDDLLARLDQLRDTIAVRYQKKFSIGLIVDATDQHEAALRLKKLQAAVEGGNLLPDDAADLEQQIQAAIAKLNPPE
jgi:hypothetical protein